MINIDEIKHLKSQLSKLIAESDQLKLLNRKLINENQRHEQISSPKQVS
jgi:regulator of replication initiation timing